MLFPLKSMINRWRLNVESGAGNMVELILLWQVLCRARLHEPEDLVVRGRL